MLHTPQTTRAGVGHQLPIVPLLGVGVTNATKEDAVALMDAWIQARDGRTRAVFIVNAHTLNLAWDRPAYRAVLNSADAVFGDGAGVRLAARLERMRMRDNLVGTDLLPAFFRAQSARGYGYFLLGGSPGTPERGAQRLRQNFPGIRIAGCHHGFFGEQKAADVIRLINAAAPDMLLVAMGNPLQEEWIHRHRMALRVPVAIGVGGLFDHWSGALRRAPRWVRKLSLEWVQLLMQQPNKWPRYLLGNPKFVLCALSAARRIGPRETFDDGDRPVRPDGETGIEQRGSH
jgi:N-acetylglucosaminyldiphosphoundecaprenol N-acetyl-beta-D-mannosaminyltransferase